MAHSATGSFRSAGNVYTLTYANQEQLIVTDHGFHLTVKFCALEDREDGSLHGLIGNFDGDASNDIATRDGTVLPIHPTFTQLYDEFANSWRISQEESLFDYDGNETTDTFTDLNCPASRTTNTVLPRETVRGSRAAPRRRPVSPTRRCAKRRSSITRSMPIRRTSTR